MSWGMVAVAGASLVGGAIAANGAKSAANSQSAAADRASEAQREMFDKQVELQEPWRQGGGLALNALEYGLGLSPSGTFNPGATFGSGTAGQAASAPTTTETAEQIRQRLAPQFSGGQTITGWSGGTAEENQTPIYGASVNDAAGLDAAVQAELARQGGGATQVSPAQWDAAINVNGPTTLRQQYAAYVQRGGRLSDAEWASRWMAGTLGSDEKGGQPNGGVGPNIGFGNLLKNFTSADFQADPGYAFRQSEQQKALERAASAQGGIGSGKFLKDAMSYSGGLAAQEYGNAFNRFNTNRDSLFNKLASVAGIGQTATNQVGNAAGNFGSQIGGNIIGAGNARAAGQVGSANALNGGISQGISMYQQNQMMNRLFPGGGSSYGSWGGSPMSNLLYSNGSLGD